MVCPSGVFEGLRGETVGSGEDFGEGGTGARLGLGAREKAEDGGGGGEVRCY